jgi:phospholipase/carboxylesterase
MALRMHSRSASPTAICSHTSSRSHPGSWPLHTRLEPHIYISHGTHDAVLPIERCSRRLVPILERAGYDVKYHEFDGPHTIPPDIAREAVEWFVPLAG